MELLEQRIVSDGKVLPGNVLKVGNFLNHQIDVDLVMQMGAEIARIFADTKIDKILTIETSGVAIAFAAANYIKVPVVFAKKNKSSNIDADTFGAPVHSFTHGNDYHAVVSKQFLKRDENVLIVDDFLANGSALKGLIDILTQAGANCVGAAVAIEKGFQLGGDQLREQGYRIESMALIDSMEDGKIVFRR